MLKLCIYASCLSLPKKKKSHETNWFQREKTRKSQDDLIFLSNLPNSSAQNLLLQTEIKYFNN